MSAADPQRLRGIKTFPQLVKYLREELDWPVESDEFDVLTFEYEPEELGLDAKSAVKVKEIKQLRPFHARQPWGVFFINFEPKRLPVVVLRRILSALVVKKRHSAGRAHQAVWKLHDLLFISSYGESAERTLTFAHFSEGETNGDLPTLRVLTWDDQDTVLHLDHAHRTLREKLRFPDNPEDAASWRQSWSSAFTLRHREVITTSKALAVRLAELATRIRRRANAVLAVESDKGELRKLHAAFQAALIHDLTGDDFADTYAQTISYGLLTARVSRHSSDDNVGGIVAENLSDMVPKTNPFLKELLSTFLFVGGRKGRLDFDELGINEVIELLREANMEAILRDFGDRNPQEDPVIHFYELFLKEYDAKKRMQRGVFYTPRPVVSYIVRSVHELLQTEFGLEDGLADTTTWGEMKRRFDCGAGFQPASRKEEKQARMPAPQSCGAAFQAASSRSDQAQAGMPAPQTASAATQAAEFKIPDGVSPDTPFVQILDPATGTATFLVEVIDVIHKTMVAKWTKQGHTEMFDIPRLWNEYVPKHLLPRLHGYELMMAPYAIAHMKIGLKLFETGYKFGSGERARIYLTNALEPPQDFSDTFEQMAPALAHEAKAVNEVKRHQRFTVVIGNPPYANFGQLNRNRFILQLLDDYKRGLEEKKLNLDDDYLKFYRFGQHLLDDAGTGIFGMITNSSFVDGLIHRQMRQRLLAQFNCGHVLDLHGNSRRGDKAPDGGADENVFDIQQGVAISLWSRSLGSRSARVSHADLWGLREQKYGRLIETTQDSSGAVPLRPSPPHFLLIKQDASLTEEYTAWPSLADAMSVIGSGLNTDRDELCIDFEAGPLVARMKRVFSGKVDAQFVETYNFRPSSSYDPVEFAQRQGFDPKAVRTCIYRPFDFRRVYYKVGFTSRPVFDVQGHMLRPNVGLLVCRQSKEPFAVLVGRHLATHKIVAVYDRTSLAPLWLYHNETKGQRTMGADAPISAFKPAFLKGFTHALGPGSDPSPDEVFRYVYAVFHSGNYRARYAELLKNDFPRIALPLTVGLFRFLVSAGNELVALHLMESARLEKPITNYTGPTTPEVEKVSYVCGAGFQPAGTRSRMQAGMSSPQVGFQSSNLQAGMPAPQVGTVWLDKKQSWGFAGVPEAVWNFHIGGYQVCHKWLKDRRGRTLSAEDIAHYQKVVVALNETIRLMKEIDEVIEQHGGWPGAFVTKGRDQGAEGPRD